MCLKLASPNSPAHTPAKDKQLHGHEDSCRAGSCNGRRVVITALRKGKRFKYPAWGTISGFESAGRKTIIGTLDIDIQVTSSTRKSLKCWHMPDVEVQIRKQGIAAGLIYIY